MKNLGKATLGGFLALAIVGCGESGKFGDKEYTHDYLNENSNAKVLVELVEFCEANKNANLSTMQMKNCETGNQIKNKLEQDGWGNPKSSWDKLVEQYGSKNKK